MEEFESENAMPDEPKLDEYTMKALNSLLNLRPSAVTNDALYKKYQDIISDCIKERTT